MSSIRKEKVIMMRKHKIAQKLRQYKDQKRFKNLIPPAKQYPNLEDPLKSNLQLQTSTE